MAVAKRDDAAAVPHRLWRRLRGQLSSGLVFGLIGMLTGVLSLALSYRTQHEQAAVDFVAYPSAGSTDLTHAGLGVRVQLVNQSLRPVIVRSASLWQGQTRVADASGYLEDARALDRANIDPAAISQDRLNFPLGLNAREGRTVAFLLDVWRPIVGVADPKAAAEARNRLNQVLIALGRTLSASDARQVELQLELAPGGIRRFPLHRLVTPGVYPEAIRDASEIQHETTLQNWVVAPLRKGRRLIGLLLRRTFAGAGEVDLVRLEVWKERSRLHQTIVRPVVGQQDRLFPLARLPSGAYTAVFELDGRVVAYTEFSLPWHRTCALEVAGGVASTGNGTAHWC
jgi:hypothetical protein